MSGCVAASLLEDPASTTMPGEEEAFAIGVQTCAG